ncbi:hypothetical protein T492DRAFT_875323 [Pavlovales sp. CCMP2436]|nr:hypothetical protein T492DRAFT_875323 [Pavlovales sp. CCMP2436]
MGISSFGGSAVCSWLRSTHERCWLVIALALLCGLLLLTLTRAIILAWAGLLLVAVSIGGEGTLWAMIAEQTSSLRAGGGLISGLVNTLIGKR